MERMVTYLISARKNQANFEEYLSNNPIANPGIDLTVTVLTTGFWPSYRSFDLNLPAEMIELSGIHDTIKLSDDDVVRLLHSLSSVKYKILNKESSTKTISPTDVLSSTQSSLKDQGID
ncbi:hypothetical protein R3W88_001429 [Solanum pinnatisectum]|uniref:Cullin family profile domain-containing protein n=1 Tax=Solanum pinnatisectum TaxID=50273 RepID=A0AAV9MK73_9SOLN|nr:hypothetical protein R3W88_001429 [Solanum pinnatisectum]